MKIYGNISTETMAQHEWVTLEDYLVGIAAEIERIASLDAALAAMTAAREKEKNDGK